MTYEELLSICDNYSFKDSAEPVKALRAVVELHKPELMISSSYCVECTIDLETVTYPCSTIQAIQKELS